MKRNVKHARHWEVEFPTVLEGVVDMHEYNQVSICIASHLQHLSVALSHFVCTRQVITRLNTIIDEVLKKWYYKDGFIYGMLFSGAFIILPIVPACVTASKRSKKVIICLVRRAVLTITSSYARR